MVVMACKQHTEDGGDYDCAHGNGAARPPCVTDGQMDSMQASSTRLIPAKAEPLRAQMFFQIWPPNQGNPLDGHRSREASAPQLTVSLSAGSTGRPQVKRAYPTRREAESSA